MLRTTSRTSWAPWLGALFAALTLCLAVMAPGAAQARSFATGLLDPEPFEAGDPVAFQRAKAAGVKYVKTNLVWAAVAPNPEPANWVPTDPGSPHYNWAKYDAMARGAAAQGLQVIFDIVNGPPWTWVCGEPQCAPDPQDFRDFAFAAALRYNGTYNPTGGGSLAQGPLPAVRYWQAWVEPNLDFFYKPVFNQSGQPVSPYTYRTLLNVFYDAVHAANPAALVLSAGLAPLQRPNHTIGPLDFMRRMLCMRGRRNPRPIPGCNRKSKLDIWTMHPYTTGGPTHHAPGPDDVSLGDLQQMTDLLRAADRAGRIVNRSRFTPFWITEFSWDTAPPDPGGVKMKLHARWVAEALYRIFKAGLSNMVWFRLRDEQLGGTSSGAFSSQSGFYFRGATLAQDRPKRSLYAFRFPFVAFKTRVRRKPGFLFWGRTPDSRRHTLFIEVKRGRRYVRVRRVVSNASGIFQGKVVGRYRRNLVRAKYTNKREKSLPFSLKPVADFYQPPFGSR